MVHGCMVYTERAETAAVSCGTSHASAVSTPVRWIFMKIFVTFMTAFVTVFGVLDYMLHQLVYQWMWPHGTEGAGEVHNGV